ncbi:MAG: SDR family NAD(P)-dependent oxidoreductase [Anaerolineae bacterium]|nr:SDR family NAD(P)-dependent oxidoreductase [Anaerolineae bacterium]
MKLKGRVALITGGGQGIGRATALLFAREGARVALVARRRDRVEAVKEEIERQGGQALAISADVSVPADTRRMVAQTVEAFGSVDILVAAAGIFTYGHVVDHDDDAWLNLLKVNLYGVYLSDKAVLPVMIKNHWGRIINLSATSAFTAAPGWSAQCAAKTGILGLTRALAQEVASKGITVNAICPAWVRTSGADEAGEIEARAMGMTLDQYWEWTIKSYYPMGRITEPEEQAHLMLYIASEEAAGLTGQAIALTAGSPW